MHGATIKILYITFTRLVKYDVNSRPDILSFFPSNQTAAKCVGTITTFNLIIRNQRTISHSMQGNNDNGKKLQKRKQ